MSDPLRIIFMGTPDFAVSSLTSLHNSPHEIVMVVTQPDRPRGRGRKLLPTAVKAAALDMGYPVIQPVSVKTGEFTEQVKSLKPDLLIVVAFGHILSESLLALPRLGAVNVHASLLPKYRGPAPIQRAIMEGEKETGVTIMFMDKGLDTGDMLMHEIIPITTETTCASLHDQLAETGADLLSKTLHCFETNTIKPIPQDHDLATYAPALTKQDCRITWEESAETIACQIRGLSPKPGAYAFFNDKRLKMLHAVSLPKESNLPPGTVMESFPDELWIASGNNQVVSILKIQSPAGKTLAIADFLRGHPIEPGARFS